jgi:hypothetical protein
MAHLRKLKIKKFINAFIICEYIDKAQVSYGCDRRLHFSHPKLK